MSGDARPYGAPSGMVEADMKSDELRALQAPIKQRYREQPEAALITLKAQGTLGEGVTCSEIGRAHV